MKLGDLVRGLGGTQSGDAEVRGLCIDSRRAAPGDLFICLPGAQHDPHQFIEDAAENGAESFVVFAPSTLERLGNEGKAVVLFEDSVDACWRIAKRFYDDPSSSLQMLGVTGTNGKTTVAWLVHGICMHAGKKSAYIGTLGAYFGDSYQSISHTTPFAPEIQQLLRRALDENCTAVAMEVSSHSLAQRRIFGVGFDVGVFTNLTQDHLDFHADMEEYYSAKKLLFDGLPTSKNISAVINSDDAYGVRLSKELHKSTTFGAPPADLPITEAKVGISKISFETAWKGEKLHVEAPIGGMFNVSNCAAALAGAISLGIPAKAAADALRYAKSVPGRFETVPADCDFTIMVDYAHTPDALAKLLQSVREITKGRVLTVFGCGGDRDKGKRPKMAAAAAQFSDHLFVTSDNPRTENPLSIIKDIVDGLPETINHTVEPDRRAAIRAAICEARGGDVVVIAGKGHEDYQIIGDKKMHFDDREVAASIISERAPCT